MNNYFHRSAHQEIPGRGNIVNAAQVKKRATQLATSVMPSGAATGPFGAAKGADTIRSATPEPLPTPEGHEDTNPIYDRVR